MSSVDTTSSDRALLAIGVISVPEQVERRALLRATWLHKPWAGDGGPVTAHFVVRAGGAPAWLDEQLGHEQAQHADILRVPVSWDESRLRGPVLTLAAFITHAAQTMRARYIAKVDDDAYVHVADLEYVMRRVHAEVPGRNKYLGMITWQSWFPEKWDRVGFGWRHAEAERGGRRCHNASWAAARCGDGCGPCSGPFPFAAGYLIALSAPLAAHLAAALPAECERLRRAHDLVTNRGYSHTRIFEDVWLGSFLHRNPPRRPVSYVSTTRSGLVSDLEMRQWQSVVMRSAMVVHVRSKETRTLLALRRHMDGPAHCSPAANMSCARGCKALGVYLPRTERADAPCADAVQCRIATERSEWCRADVDLRQLIRGKDVRAEAETLLGAVQAERARLSRARDLAGG